MWQFIKDAPAAIKLGMSIVGGLVAGGTVTWGLMLNPVQQNSAAIAANTERLQAAEVRELRLERSLDSLRADMTLVRCWARHEIEGSDPSECLFGNGGRP